MNITIKKLTPELAQDYVDFFDNTPHDDNIDEHKCYCVCWCNKDYEGEDFSSRDKRRSAALRYIKEGNIKGYLAYQDDKIVGWCNANIKSDCLQCFSWQTFMKDFTTEESATDESTLSIFCFVIAPEMRRKGIATMLLEHICSEAAIEGFEYVEAYPFKDTGDTTKVFGGTYEMYKKFGFNIHQETDDRYAVRKALKENNSGGVSI